MTMLNTLPDNKNISNISLNMKPITNKIHDKLWENDHSEITKILNDMKAEKENKSKRVIAAKKLIRETKPGFNLVVDILPKSMRIAEQKAYATRLRKILVKYHKRGGYSLAKFGITINHKYRFNAILQVREKILPFVNNTVNP